MKALTLTAPYGTLIAVAATHPALGKRIETRGWATTHRGPLAIHQTAAPGPKGTTEATLWDRCLTGAIGKALLAAGLGNPARLPRGKIVAVADLVDCVQMLYDWPRNQVVSSASGHILTDQERAFGDYRPGRWAWLLTNVRALSEPIACRGYQGLWTVPADIEAQIAAQLATQLAAPRCPRCGQPHDASMRMSGDRVWCTRADAWFEVRFTAEGTQLLPAEAPAGWPKERRMKASAE